jgi:hypothetical protein
MSPAFLNSLAWSRGSSRLGTAPNFQAESLVNRLRGVEMVERSNNSEVATEAAYQTMSDMLGPGLSLLPYAEVDLKHRPEIGESVIIAWCRQNEDSDRRTNVLVLHFLHRCKQMQIPTIMMPQSMAHERLGKRTIHALFQVAESCGYQLLVVNMVQSFYERLLKRGAQPADLESVFITANTDLVGDVGSPWHNPDQVQPFDLEAFLRDQ